MSINYTAATLAVLDALGKNPRVSLHTRKVAEEAGVSVGTASQVLRALESSGLLIVEDKGNMRFYRMNLANALSRQWKVLFNINRLKDLTEELSSISEQVVLFGSGAEGLDSVESDLDIFILTQHERAVKDVLRRYEKRINRALSPIILDPLGYSRLRRQDPALYENISRGKALWARE